MGFLFVNAIIGLRMEDYIIKVMPMRNIDISQQNISFESARGGQGLIPRCLRRGSSFAEEG